MWASMEDASRTFRNELTKKIQIILLVSGGALGFAFHWLPWLLFPSSGIFQVSKSISFN